MGDDREALLESFRGLRVTDVCDAMDALGYMDRGQVAPEIRPLWRDIEGFTHRVYGIAYTLRLLPTTRQVPELSERSVDEYKRWMRTWYDEIAPTPKPEQLTKGDVVVIDGEHCGTVGFIGSNNALGWMAGGAVGAVTNGACRDTDELMKQRVPVYSRDVRKTVRPGRLELDGVGVSVNIGGAQVRPGDVVVADGDGVVSVPREVASEVARIGWTIAEDDRAKRRTFYETLGMREDFTLASAPGRPT